MQLNSLQDVFREQLEDLYDAERQLVSALPELAAAATTDELRDAIGEHLEETKGHVQRLESILAEVGVTMSTEHCEAMGG
jgi:ferritin-like metal-binding protein YciE